MGKHKVLNDGDIVPNPYDQVTRAYLQQNVLDDGEGITMDDFDINYHPLLKTVALIIDQALTHAEIDLLNFDETAWNLIEEEINTLRRMQEVFEDGD